jgi:glycosyltransferase involved in cell wall biosynthesis
MHVLSSVRNDFRVLREATTLLEEGYEVSIVDVESGRFSSTEDIQGIKVKHVLMPKSFATTRFKKWALFRVANIFIRSTIYLLRSSADIYHAHDVTALPACFIAATIRRKPLIFDAHELPLSEIRERWDWLSKLLVRLLVGLVRRCSGIITVSSPIAQEICNRFQASNVSLVRNIPLYQLIHKTDKIRHYLGLCPEVRIALYQGNIQPDRQLDRLVRAAAFLERNTVIVLMGKGVGSTSSELEALASREGVADSVKILPPVPYEELLEWTASADIGLIAYSPDHSLNVRMCLPNKLFEYLMAGLPILTSSLDAVSDIIRTYDIGLIASSLTPADIGASINAMLADPVALATMHCNALNAAQKEFYWEKESQQLIHLYSNVLAKKTSSFDYLSS